mmetsp:Transcript_24839/g.57247  ORF Transcript_24839/g.57247 Transcript_24839/m.57247 type:complete len:448 (-) Transcript_24839:408-1751(-)
MASILSLWRSKSHARQPTFYFLSFLGAPFFTTGGLFGQGGSGNFSAIVSAGAIFLDFSLDFGHQDNIRDDDGRVETAFGIPFHRCGRQVVSEHIVSYLQQVSQVRYTAKTLIIDSKVRLPRHFYIGQGIFFHPAVGSLVHCILPAPSSLLAELQVEHHEPHHPSGLQQHTDVFLTFPVAIGRELVEERGKRGTSGRRRVYQPRRARDALHQRQPTRQPAGASPRPLEHNQVVAYQRHHVRHHRHLHVGRIILGVGGDQPPARANPERHESRQCRRGRLRLRLSGEVEIEAGPGHVYREHFFAEFGTTRQHGLNGAHAYWNGTSGIATGRAARRRRNLPAQSPSIRRWRSCITAPQGSFRNSLLQSGHCRVRTTNSTTTRWATDTLPSTTSAVTLTFSLMRLLCGSVHTNPASRRRTFRADPAAPPFRAGIFFRHRARSSGLSRSQRW